MLVWSVLVFYLVLPHVFGVTALDHFRIPKDVFASSFIILLGAGFLLTQPFWPRGRPRPVILLLWAGLFYLLLHCLWLGHAGVSRPAFRQVFLFVMLLLMLQALLDGRRQRRVWTAFGISMAAAAVMTVLQYFGLFPLMERAGGTLLSGRATPSGFVGNVNTGGFLFGLAVLGLLTPAVLEKRLKVRLLVLGLLSANLLGLLFTRTLTAIGGLSLCLVLWLPFHHWWLWRQPASFRRRLVRFWGVILLFLVVGLGAAYTSGAATRLIRTAERMAAGEIGPVLSGRLPAFFITWQMISEKPWTGHGLDTYGQEFFFARVDTEYGRQLSIRSPGAFREAHNEYLQIWAELGLPALLLFLAVWLLAVVRVIQRAVRLQDQERVYRHVLQSLSAVFILISNLTFFPFHLSVSAAVAILVLACLLSEESEHGAGYLRLGELLGERQVLLWGARILILAGAAFWLTFPLGTWSANRSLGTATLLLERAQTAGPRGTRLLADEAGARLDRAHRLAPHIREYWNLRGTAFLMLGRYQEARQYYEKAIQKLPTPETYTNLAASCMQARDYEAARSHLETALRYNPRYSKALEALETLEARSP